MAEVISFSAGPPPFGYTHVDFQSGRWQEVPEEQMIIEYMVSLRAVGESLRRISETVESVYGKRITHAGVDKILKRRATVLATPRPITESLPSIESVNKLSTIFSKEIERQQMLEQPLTKMDGRLDCWECARGRTARGGTGCSLHSLSKSSDAYWGVCSAIRNGFFSDLEKELMLARITLGAEKLTDGIDGNPDDMRTIEGSYGAARAREEYLREQKIVLDPAKQTEFKPGDVVEFDTTKWKECCGRFCNKYTQDPKAAGWHNSEIDDSEWECEGCWQKGFTHTWADFKKGKLALRINSGADEITKDFTPKTIATIIKDLQACTKPNAEQKKELKFWKNMAERLKNAGLGGGMSLGREDSENTMLYRILGFDPSTLPPLPETIKL